MSILGIKNKPTSTRPPPPYGQSVGRALRTKPVIRILSSKYKEKSIFDYGLMFSWLSVGCAILNILKLTHGAGTYWWIFVFLSATIGIFVKEFSYIKKEGESVVYYVPVIFLCSPVIPIYFLVEAIVFSPWWLGCIERGYFIPTETNKKNHVIKKLKGVT